MNGIEDVTASADSGIEVDPQSETDWSIYVVPGDFGLIDPGTDSLYNEDIFPELVEGE